VGEYRERRPHGTIISKHDHLETQSSRNTVISKHSHLETQSSRNTVISKHSHLETQSSRKTVISKQANGSDCRAAEGPRSGQRLTINPAIDNQLGGLGHVAIRQPQSIPAEPNGSRCRPPAGLGLSAAAAQ
jgi:hypothetical protein